MYCLAAMDKMAKECFLSINCTLSGKKLFTMAFFSCLSKANKRDAAYIFHFSPSAMAQRKSHFSGSVSDVLVECGSIFLARPKVSDLIV